MFINNDFEFARVITENKANYIVKSEKYEVFAEVSGKIMYSAN